MENKHWQKIDRSPRAAFFITRKEQALIEVSLQTFLGGEKFKELIDLFSAAPEMAESLKENAGRMEMAARYIRRQVEKGANSVETEYLSLEGIAEGLDGCRKSMLEVIAKAEGRA